MLYTLYCTDIPALGERWNAGTYVQYPTLGESLGEPGVRYFTLDKRSDGSVGVYYIVQIILNLETSGVKQYRCSVKTDIPTPNETLCKSVPLILFLVGI
jgi:hypothetical protein